VYFSYVAPFNFAWLLSVAGSCHLLEFLTIFKIKIAVDTNPLKLNEGPLSIIAILWYKALILLHWICRLFIEMKLHSTYKISLTSNECK